MRRTRILSTHVVGIEPEGVAASPDGQWVYITTETSDSVSVIDGKKRAAVRLQVEVMSRAVDWSRDGRRACVSSASGGAVFAIDAHRSPMIFTFPTDRSSGKPVGGSRA